MKLPESRRGFPTYQDPSGAEPARPRPEQAESRGFRISYDDVGEGSLIALISGFTQSGADWWELGYPVRLRSCTVPGDDGVTFADADWRKAASASRSPSVSILSS